MFCFILPISGLVLANQNGSVFNPANIYSGYGNQPWITRKKRNFNNAKYITNN